ncbi:unnamed protein product, partial [Mesorhabditis spiculigera]
MAELPVQRADALLAVQKFLKEISLTELTSSKVRHHLAAEFGKDFTECSTAVDELIRESITQMQNSSSSSKTSPVATINQEKKQPPSAPEESSDDGVDDLLPRAKLRRSASGNASTSHKKKGARTRSRGTSRFSAVCAISEDLQEITQKPFMRRCDVVKSMWKYITDNNLKNPKNKKMVLCDDKLRKVFKKNSFLGFGMMKHLAAHIFKPEDLGPEFVAQAEQVQKEIVEELNRKQIASDNDMLSENDSDEGDGKPAQKKSKSGIHSSQDKQHDEVKFDPARVKPEPISSQDGSIHSEKDRAKTDTDGQNWEVDLDKVKLEPLSSQDSETSAQKKKNADVASDFDLKKVKVEPISSQNNSFGAEDPERRGGRRVLSAKTSREDEAAESEGCSASESE